MTRDLVFDRVCVDCVVRGGTRVSWTFFYQFADPGPYTFQLQVGGTAERDADDWEDVGAPAVNAFYAVDDVQRVDGTAARTHYRVVVTTDRATHTSRAVPVDGLLGVRDWLLAREIVRKESLLFDRYTAVKGRLLKRRHTGIRPPNNDPRVALTDPLTGEVIRHASKVGFGTKYEGGYFAPVPFDVQMEPGSSDPDVDDQSGGNVDATGLVHKGRVIVIPQIDTRDVFVAHGSDLRYYIHLRNDAGAVRGVPVVRECEFRQADFNDVIYDVPVIDHPDRPA